MHGRVCWFSRTTPSATSARFSPSMGMRSATVPMAAKSVNSSMGMRSATVPMAAKSVNSRHRCGWPKRPPSACTTFRATPAPASTALLQSLPHFGSVSGTPSGTASPGSWWSVMASPKPAATISAASFLQEMPQSTVTMNWGLHSQARLRAASVSA